MDIDAHFGGDDRTHWERMVAGNPYVADGPEFDERGTRARTLTYAYQRAFDEGPDRRRAVLDELLGQVGADVEIRPPLLVEYGEFISIGDRTFVNFALTALDVAPIRIGADCQIGPGVQLLTPTHPLDPDERRSRIESAEPISIGDNVWLGGGVIVCPGVTIGDDTVVGAGSVVTRDLPPRVVAVGNPARVIRALPPATDPRVETVAAHAVVIRSLGLGNREDLGTILGDRNGVLDVHRPLGISGDRCPPVVEDGDLACASTDHGLERQHVAGPDAWTGPGSAGVVDRRRLVHRPPNPVTREAFGEVIPRLGDDAAHDGAVVTEASARDDRGDSGSKSVLGGLDESPRRRVDGADADGERRVAVPTLDDRAAVHRDHIAVVEHT